MSYYDDVRRMQEQGLYTTAWARENLSNCTTTSIPIYNIEDLEIVKPFDLIDIYEKDPCKDEFLELLKGQRYFLVKAKWEDVDDMVGDFILLRNLSWLVDNEFLRKKKKETKLVPGMILERNDGQYFVTNKGVFNMSSGIGYTYNKYETLEVLNKEAMSCNGIFKVIKQP